MPYKNPKQPIAVFLSIKRKEGLQAAEAFAHKHSGEMSKSAKAIHGKRPYKARKRSKNV